MNGLYLLKIYYYIFSRNNLEVLAIVDKNRQNGNIRNFYNFLPLYVIFF